MASRLQPWPSAASFLQRWAAAERAAERLRKKLRQNENVLRVAAGLEREARGARNALVTLPGLGRPDDDVIPCVQIQVRRKWTTRAQRRGAFPEVVAGKVKVGRHSVTVQIPVDVIEAPRDVALHAAQPIVGRDESGHRIPGTTTCFVQARGVKGPLLLSCHHVLALTRDAPLPERDAYVEYAAERNGKVVGHLVALPLTPRSLDAALANFRGSASNVISSGANQIRLRKVWTEANLPLRYLIATQRGVFRASLITREARSFLYFGGEERLYFDDVVLSTLEEDGQQMRGGDSGSPLFLPDGTLLGIHFAGERGGSPYSYAMRADRILASFSKPLRLWPD